MIEYRNVPAGAMAKRTVLACGLSARHRVTYELIYSTAGYECAGSCARETNEKWGAIFTDSNGTTGGQWFKTESEARARFAQVVSS